MVSLRAVIINIMGLHEKVFKKMLKLWSVNAVINANTDQSFIVKVTSDILTK